MFEDQEFQELPPEFQPKTAPFNHQRQALERSWWREGFGLYMDMGTGKSKVVIDNFCLLYTRGECDALVVVAPKSVYTNWTRQNKERPGEWYAHSWPTLAAQALVHTWQSGSRHPPPPALLAKEASGVGARILAINAEALSSVHAARVMLKLFLVRHRAMLAVDESTLMGSLTSRRTKFLLAMAPLAKYRRVLDGTPGNPEKLFPQTQFLKPGLLGHRTYATYRPRYCILRDIVVGGRVKQITAGYQHVDELSERLAPHVHRVRAEECLDLPPRVYERVEIELTDEQRRAYNEMKRKALVEWADGRTTTTQVVITQVMRLHQILCGCTTADDGTSVPLPSARPAALLDILEHARGDRQVVVWAPYRPAVDAVVALLRERYGAASVAEYHGGISPREREAGEDDFQAGRRRFMVSDPQTGARGRNWTAGRLVIYYGNARGLDSRQQSERRTWRQGTMGSVTYVDIVVPGTLDEKILDAFRAERDVIAEILRDGPEAWF